MPPEFRRAGGLLRDRPGGIVSVRVAPPRQPDLVRSPPALVSWITIGGDLAALLFAWLASTRLFPPAPSGLVVMLLCGLPSLTFSAGGLHSQLRAVGALSLLGRVLAAWVRLLLVLGLLSMLVPGQVPQPGGLRFAALFLPGLLAVRFGTMQLRHWVRRRGFNQRSL